jgi:hypothetical protein
MEPSTFWGLPIIGPSLDEDIGSSKEGRPISDYGGASKLCGNGVRKTVTSLSRNNTGNYARNCEDTISIMASAVTIISLRQSIINR